MENTVFIGNKPVMSYVLAVVTQFNDNDAVIIKARGKAITRAVDTAEVVRKSFVSDAQIKDINISTEEFVNHNDEKTNVSVIQIILEKP